MSQRTLASAPEAKPPIVSGFLPIQRLYEAARRLVDHEPNDRLARHRLGLAVLAIEEAAEVSESLPFVREAARRAYDLSSTADAAIEIDDADFVHHDGQGGYWVGAWLWVSDLELT